MDHRAIWRAALLGLALLLPAAAPATAQTLRISEGRVERALTVPLNRAVVLESEAAFAELSVANPLIADIATLSERTVYVLGKQPGRTTLTLLGPDGRLIANLEVQVIPDIAEFKERLRELLPGEPVEVRTANDGIILSGTVSSIQKVEHALEIAQRYAPERVTNLMSVGGTQQVQLKVRFAEMSRNVGKEIGASFGLTGSDLNGGSFQGTTGNVANSTGILRATLGGNSLSLNILLSALEEQGVVRTLSEPNLTALSGQPADFLAGGEIPVPVIDDEGNVGVEFKPFGVGLKFIPTVVTDDIINIAMESEVSSVTDSSVTINGASIPNLTTRRANTTVELRDGQSFAIAGILQDEFANGRSSVPFLGDLPVVGALFRSARYQRRQTELVIIVTVSLVNPTSGDAFLMPYDRIRPPTENELFLQGRLVRRSTDTRASSRGGLANQDFSGSYGYVLE